MANYSIFVDLLIRFALNFIVAFIIIRFVYYPKEKKNEYIFTFFIFNALIFFVCSFLIKMKIDLGFAFGLFAIFTILRYRTQTIPIREMTYQFLLITLGAIHGLASFDLWLWQLVFVNIILLVFTFVFDSNRVIKGQCTQLVQYEKIELIKPERREDLIEDLRRRTGLDINRVKIENINFLRDTAEITVYFAADDNG